MTIAVGSESVLQLGVVTAAAVHEAPTT